MHSSAEHACEPALLTTRQWSGRSCTEPAKLLSTLDILIKGSCHVCYSKAAALYQAFPAEACAGQLSSFHASLVQQVRMLAPWLHLGGDSLVPELPLYVSRYPASQRQHALGRT